MKMPNSTISSEFAQYHLLNGLDATSKIKASTTSQRQYPMQHSTTVQLNKSNPSFSRLYFMKKL